MELFPHQTEAIEQFKRYYYEENRTRGVISAACGTGKTYLSYNIIKSCIIKGEQLFVFATPSLNLISQITANFLSWLDHDKIRMPIIIIASDNGKFVDKNGKKYTNYKYMKADTTIPDNAIIITTYASSAKIIELIQKPIDLVIMDEAHNTVGTDGKRSQKLINIQSAKKILFMTASLIRMYTKKNGEKYFNVGLSYSMDNAEIYGDIVYDFSFKQAIEHKRIVPYELITLQSTTDITIDLNDYNIVDRRLIYYNSIIEFMFAASTKLNIKNIIVYLENIERLTLFHELLKNCGHYEAQQLHKIYGTSDPQPREVLAEFKIFREYSRILLCVDMLDEGIDLPMCDCVLFTYPRNSENIIIQNIGRCLRNYSNSVYTKNMAYVMLPVNVVTLEDNSIHSSKFKTIRDVMSIMKSADSQFCNRAIKLTKSDDTEPVAESMLKDDEIIITKSYLQQTQCADECQNIGADIVDQANIKVTNIDPANASLDSIKQIIRVNRIHNIIDFIMYMLDIRTCNWPHLMHPNYICYGTLLYGSIASYNDAKIILKLFNTYNVTGWRSFEEFYNTEIEHAIEAIRSVSDYNFEHLQQLILVPCNPKKYYDASWIDWSDFLGRNVPKTIGHYSVGTAVIDPLKSLINEDKQIIQQIIGPPTNYNIFYTKLNIACIVQFATNQFEKQERDIEITIRYKVTQHTDQLIFKIEIKNKDCPYIGAMIRMDKTYMYDSNYKNNYSEFIKNGPDLNKNGELGANEKQFIDQLHNELQHTI